MVQARRRTWIRKRAKSTRIHCATGLRNGTEFRRGPGLVLQGGRPRKFQCGKSARIYESVRTWNSAGFCPGACVVSHRGGSREPHGDRKFEGLVRTAAGSGCRALASSKRRGSAGRGSSVSATDTDREPPATG